MYLIKTHHTHVHNFQTIKKDGDIKVKIKYHSFSIGHGTSSKSDTHFIV